MATKDTPKTMGEQAFDAYVASLRKPGAVAGAVVPQWEGLSSETQGAWEAAASVGSEREFKAGLDACREEIQRLHGVWEEDFEVLASLPSDQRDDLETEEAQHAAMYWALEKVTEWIDSLATPPPVDESVQLDRDPEVQLAEVRFRDEDFDTEGVTLVVRVTRAAYRRHSKALDRLMEHANAELS